MREKGNVVLVLSFCMFMWKRHEIASHKVSIVFVSLSVTFSLARSLIGLPPQPSFSLPLPLSLSLSLSSFTKSEGREVDGRGQRVSSVESSINSTSLIHWLVYVCALESV